LNTSEATIASRAQLVGHRLPYAFPSPLLPALEIIQEFRIAPHRRNGGKVSHGRLMTLSAKSRA
jgi:hypothetical protein